MEKRQTKRAGVRKPTRKLTERQTQARARQLRESRSLTKEERRARGSTRSDVSKRQTHTGGVRITSLIVDELGKALATVLKFDGPADVLMSRFFRNKKKRGSPDRSNIYE